MLVLTRRKAETIRIGDNIEVHVIDVHRGRVRLGIQAPREISVLRSEIIDPQSASGDLGTALDAVGDTSAAPVFRCRLR